MASGGKNKVFVGGLPQDCPTEALQEYFEKFGTITDVVVMTDRGTGRSRGFGFVSFDEPEAVDEVMSMHQDHQIQGKWIDCKRATAEGTKGLPSSGGKGGGSRGSDGGKGDVRPGDWRCSCGTNNFASKTNCFKCGAPKPQGGGGYGGSYGGYGAPPAYGGGYGAPPAYGGGYGGYGGPPAYGAYGAPPAYGGYGAPAAYAPPAYGKGGGKPYGGGKGYGGYAPY
eukprot:TRINITY_DN789_c2_g1_i1.p1 TRINITY_DN789_c2_g1~~TRINITY_DN789_c2_g1_i1.p1  ORF type:complete len:225 (-),score=44.61 TRINITY_DN789_c2_g1_i1:127-801(-)